jgi:hypothetical protein
MYRVNRPLPKTGSIEAIESLYHAFFDNQKHDNPQDQEQNKQQNQALELNETRKRKPRKSKETHLLSAEKTAFSALEMALWPVTDDKTDALISKLQRKNGNKKVTLSLKKGWSQEIDSISKKNMFGKKKPTAAFFSEQFLTFSSKATLLKVESVIEVSRVVMHYNQQFYGHLSN